LQAILKTLFLLKINNMPEKDKEVLFELHGFKVRKNSLYTVQHRPDLDAPTGYQEMGSTKLPSEGVGDTFYCLFKQAEGAARGIGSWDTGFYSLSPCYQGLTTEESEEKVEVLVENVLEPYRKVVGDDKAMSHTDDKSIEKTPFRVWEGRVFRTESPVDVLHLYFAFMRRQLVPTHLEGDTTFNGAAFRISDVNKDIKKRDQDASTEFKAIGAFQKMLYTDKEMLYKVLRYLGMEIATETSEEALQGVFKQYLSNVNNLKTFNMVLDDMKKESGKAKIELYSILKNKVRKGGDLSITDGIIYYKDIEVGKDLKSAAGRISKEADLENVKNDLLFEE